MKRWIPACMGAVIVLAAALWLFTAVRAPGNFTGQWYADGNGQPYHFQDGIISCQDQAYMTDQAMQFSGAYCFGRNSIVLFAAGVEGLETEQELHLVHTWKGDVLCEREDGAGKIYFRREPAGEQ